MRATSEYIHILHPLTLYELPHSTWVVIHSLFNSFAGEQHRFASSRTWVSAWLSFRTFQELNIGTLEEYILCWYYRQPFTLFAAFGQILNISHDPFCCKRIMFKALFTNAPICFPPLEGDVCWWSTTHCPFVYPRMWC